MPPREFGEDTEAPLYQPVHGVQVRDNVAVEGNGVEDRLRTGHQPPFNFGELGLFHVVGTRGETEVGGDEREKAPEKVGFSGGCLGGYNCLFESQGRRSSPVRSA